ncbi:MAG: S8 family serine peptidase, partial [bacterium]
MYWSKFVKLISQATLISLVLIGIRMNTSIAWEVLGKEVKTGLWRGEEIEYAEGDIIFQLKPGYTTADLQDLLSAHNAVLIKDVDILNTGKVEVAGSVDLFKVIEAFNADHRIEIAEPNGLVSMDEYDEWFPLQWPLHNTGQTAPYGGTEDADIDAYQAWDIETGDGSVIVAILDSGVPYYRDEIGKWHFDHPDLDRSRMMVKNFVDPPGFPPVDEEGHGTFIAGIISAMSNNGIGVMGLCWNCQLLIEKILFGTDTWQSYVYDGIIYAIEQGANVINISGGGFGYFDYVERACSLAWENNVVIAAAVGNVLGDCNEAGHVKYPARFASYGELSGHENGYENVIAVGATLHNDELPSEYSCHFPGEVTVAAPGGDQLILNGGIAPYPDLADPQPYFFSTISKSTTWYNLDYGYWSGTSFSTPLVAGLAALFMSHDPSLKDRAGEVRDIIEQSAEKVHPKLYDYVDGRCDELGYGRINAYWALLEAGAGMKGDLNNDGVVNVLDLQIISSIVVQEVEPDDYQQWAGDLDYDGDIDVV